MAQVIPLSLGPKYPKPFSASDLGRGFKLNVHRGEDPFKKVVFEASSQPAPGKATIETGPSTKAYNWSKIVNDESSLKDMMEIDGKLSISYGLISGSGGGKFVQNAVSSRRSVTLMYRSRFAAFYKRLQAATIVNPVADIEQKLTAGDLEGIADQYGTKFVDTILYGAQLDVTYTLTSTTDIDLREIEAELEGKIGVGPLSIGFSAKFTKREGEERSQYNLEITASATGVHFSIPPNPSFDEMNDLIKGFNETYEEKLKLLNQVRDEESLGEEIAALGNQIEPVAFSLASIADYLTQLDKTEAAILDSKMDDLGDVYQGVMLWKSKLKRTEKELTDRYGLDNRIREEFLEPYKKQLHPVLKKLDEKLDECLEFRRLPMRRIVYDEVVPEKYPLPTEDDENLIRGLSGEDYIPSPLLIRGKEYSDVYYEGFSLKRDAVGNNNDNFIGSRSDAYLPWMSGMIKLDGDNSVVAIGDTPKDLSRDYLEYVEAQSKIPKIVTPQEWRSIGKLEGNNLQTMEREYPHERFEWGTPFYGKNSILPVTVNGWNHPTTIVSVTTPYLHGWNGEHMTFGSVLWTNGTRDEATRNSETGWLRSFVQWQAPDKGGNFQVLEGLKSPTELPEIFVRPFPFPWIRKKKIRKIDDFNEMKLKYPFDKYEWGTTYNGHSVRPLTVTTFGNGNMLRIHTQTPYPMGDDAKKIKFGVVSWTYETSDQESKKNIFYHRYLSWNTPVNEVMFSNRNHFPTLYVRHLGESQE